MKAVVVIFLLSSYQVQACSSFKIPIVATEQYPKGLGRTVPELKLKVNIVINVTFNLESVLLEGGSYSDIQDLLHDGIARSDGHVEDQVSQREYNRR